MTVQLTPSRVRRNNPYDLITGAVFENPRCDSPAPVTQQHDFHNTLHKALINQVNFEAFPEFAPGRAQPMLPFTKKDCCRLFIGQIPYGSPAQQVEWMVFSATGRRVYFTETIQRWTGTRAPKGCAHTYCLPSDRDAIIDYLHRRVLVDDTGVWIAADHQQYVALEEYCEKMKNDKSLRFRDRPYQPMVVEQATSDFVPRRPSPAPEADVHVFPPQYDQFVQAAAVFEDSNTPPPPQYDDIVGPPPMYDEYAMLPPPYTFQQ
jgi:hypothetical protein